MNSVNTHLRASIYACIGGTPLRSDIEAFRSGVQIVVGTPGRVCDMAHRGILDLSRLAIFVLDEADEMLSRGFQNQIREIFQLFPKDSQVVLLSATMPQEVLELTDSFMEDPTRILVRAEELTLEGIRQFYIGANTHAQKLEILRDLYETLIITQSVIFCNSRRTVDHLTSFLEGNNFPVASLHGELSQENRESVMLNFRNGDSRVLVTTDLLARGIDVQQVSLVINFDIPRNFENYIHRIGRGGRFGRKGISINICSDDELVLIDQIRKLYDTTIDPLPENYSQYISG